MKFTLKSWALVVISILLVLPSCKKDDLPEKSTLEVILDGKNFQAADVDAVEDQYGVLHVEISTATGQVMLLTMDLYAGKGSYDLSDTSIPMIQYQYNGVYVSESGTLKVEENNEKDQYIEGTFSGTLAHADNGGDQLDMSNGSFFIYY
jgi:hypothetical protein